MGSLASFRFEVFGKVQKVYFRKYTAEKAEALGLVGWVMNTPEGTVVGEAQGDAGKLEEFRIWLRKTGSPKSVIKDAKFTQERKGLPKSEIRYSSFEIRK